MVFVKSDLLQVQSLIWKSKNGSCLPTYRSALALGLSFKCTFQQEFPLKKRLKTSSSSLVLRIINKPTVWRDTFIYFLLLFRLSLPRRVCSAEVQRVWNQSHTCNDGHSHRCNHPSVISLKSVCTSGFSRTQRCYHRMNFLFLLLPLWIFALIIQRDLKTAAVSGVPQTQRRQRDSNTILNHQRKSSLPLSETSPRPQGSWGNKDQFSDWYE